MKGTNFDEIYGRFLGKIEDYKLLDEISEDVEFAKSVLLDYLNSSISNFTYATPDLEELKDDERECFLISLTSMEKEILASLMVSQYLSPKLIRTETLEQKLGSKDFKAFSPGNLLKELRALRADIDSRTNTLMIEYYYREGV